MTASNDSSQQSAWWATPPATWSDVSEATFAAWRDAQTSKITLDSDVARTAMAFGFGARAAYADEPEWANLLSPLEADWKAAGHEGDYPWHYIHNAARAGWLAAAPAPTGDADAAPPVVEPTFIEVVPESPVEVVPEAPVEAAPTKAPRAKAARLAAAETVDASNDDAAAETHASNVHESNDPPAPPERNVPGGRPDADASTRVVARADPLGEAQVPGGRPDHP